MTWTWLNTLPTTNLRILVTICLALATGVKVIGWNWAPPSEWLLFLSGWAAIDVGQFLAKRATFQGEDAR